MTTVLSWNKGVVMLLEEAVASGDSESYLLDLDINVLSLDLVRNILSRRLYK